MAWCWPDVLGRLNATDTGDDQHSFSTTVLAQPLLIFHLAWCDIWNCAWDKRQLAAVQAPR